MNDDPQLRKLLQDALPGMEAPTRFAAEVWQRIDGRRKANWWTKAQEMFERIFAPLSRPVVAAVTLILVAGGAAGMASVRASSENERAKSELAERHLATLDPYARMVAMR